MCGLALFFITFTQRKKGGFLCFFLCALKKNKIHNGIKNKINRSNTATEIKGMVKRIFMYFFILPSILCILFLILHTHSLLHIGCEKFLTNVFIDWIFFSLVSMYNNNKKAGDSG